MNSNSVYISMVPNGCMKAEFDSTYPVHLNGIISQDEFRDSINRVNHKIASNKILIILTITFAVSAISGMILILVAGAIAGQLSRYYIFYVLLGVGVGVTILGSIVFSTGCFITQSRFVTQIRQAIAEESMKYSSRSSIPCSWRLEMLGNYHRGFGNSQGNQPGNRLVIDIGRSILPVDDVYYKNRDANESRLSFGQQNDFELPPYSAQYAEYCSHCGALERDSTVKFCSSCGQLFNKY